MNYKKQYELLIKKHGSLSLPNDGSYFERHHVLPRSLGGKDDWYNMTCLSARCHLIAHQLLAKIHKTPQLITAYSLMAMTSKCGKSLNSRQFQKAKELISGKNSIRAKSVTTPLGTFNTVREAAKAHNTSTPTISAKCKSKFSKDYAYVNEVNVEKDGIHGLTGVGQGIHTPDGYFGSIRQAANHYNVSHKTIHRWVHGDNEGYSKRLGFFYDEDTCATRPIGGAKRKVHTPLGWFDSVAAAARAHNTGGPGTISSRCKAGWPEYYYSD